MRASLQKQPPGIQTKSMLNLPNKLSPLYSATYPRSKMARAEVRRHTGTNDLQRTAADPCIIEIDVLEIGSGTGLLSFMLAPHVRSLVGVDTASGMISAFNTKLASLTTPNLCAINHCLTNPDSPELQGACASLATQRRQKVEPPYRVDLVVSHLTLHHIPSLAEIFATMYACLKPGGVVVLTDYEDFGPEAIRFHPESKRPGVERHGIKVDEANKILVQTGFDEVKVERAFVLRKEVDAEDVEGRVQEDMDFPFLVCFGTKR